MSAPNPSSISPSAAPLLRAQTRVAPNTAHAFGGIWRLSVRRFFSVQRWLVLAVMLALLVVFSFPVALTREMAAQNFLPWVVRFYIGFLVPLLAFLSAAGTVRDDLQVGAVDYLFTRPIRRPVFLGLRYLAHVLCAQLEFLLALAVIAGVGVYRQVPELGSAMPWLLLAQVMAIFAFSAFGFLCAMLTSRYVIIGLLYGAVIEVGLGNVPTQLSQLSMSRQILGLLSPLLDRGGGLASTSLPPVAAIAVVIGASLVMLGIAALVFHWREPAAALGHD